MLHTKRSHPYFVLLCLLMALFLASAPVFGQDESTSEPPAPEEPTELPPEAPADPPAAEEPTQAPTEEQPTHVPPPTDVPTEPPTDVPPPPPVDEPTEPPVVVPPPPTEEPTEPPVVVPPVEEPVIEDPVMQEAQIQMNTFSLSVAPMSVGTPDVTPIFVAGNPSCGGLGYAHGFKVDPPAAGTYDVNGGSITVATDGVYFDWSSSFGIDAVIAKGGPNANVYVYDPPTESLGDDGLASPINPSTGNPFGLSHIEFCYDYELVVTKDAHPTFTRTYNWTIDKSVTPASWDLFTGDSGTSDYTVAVTKSAPVDSDWAVSGTITIQNPSPVAANMTGVTDSISGVGAVAVDCGVSFPYSLAAGGTLDCTYSSALPDATTRVNMATASTTGPVQGDSGTADIIFGDPTTVVNDTINVTDTYAGALGPFSASGSETYPRTFTCDGDEGTHDNTATIVETGQSDSANVTVTCHALTVTKTAVTSLTRTWNWTIEKTVEPAVWDLFKGDSGTSDYTVTVDKTGYTDSNWYVSGIITINNPAPMAATINGVSDIVSPDIVAPVLCPVAFPYSLPAGGSLICTYSTTLPDGTDRINTATATLQNYDYSSAGVATADGTTDFSGTEDVTFGDPTTVVNDTITVIDDFEGTETELGSASDDKVFTYSRTFTCDTDEGKHDNTASIVGTALSDSASVTVNCYELEVTKDAHTTFTRTYEWDIEKSVDPAIWNLFTGDSGTSQYTVAVTKTGPFDSGYAVSGTILINNPAPMAAEITAVSDVVSVGINADVSCGVSFPYILAAGTSLECEYDADLPDDTDRTNTATATLQNYDYDSAKVGTKSGTTDFSGSADVIFGDPTAVVNDTINVDDTYAGDLGSFSDSGSVTYERTFTCDADEGTHDNTATIVETGESDDASVTVTCYELDVDKDADPDFTRTWNWTIEKTGDQTELTLSVGQQFLVNYEVEVSATSTDSDWTVSGGIAIYNPAPIDATINGVADVISGFAGPVTVDCGVTFPYTLVAGGTLNCTYSADLPDGTDRINTATATLQNYAYDFEDPPAATGTTDFSGTANVTFADPTTVVDECIDVTDDQYGDLGTVCASDSPKTFEYSMYVGPYAECGTYTFVNVASFVTNDTGATGSDDHTVTVDVPCPGCTLTQGYWRTHSGYGPAPYDDTWAQIGENTPFFLSGQSYYQVLWTPPAGNAYYQLASQYIAAELNMLNGASVPANVQTAFNSATTLFQTHTPEYVAGLRGNNSIRKQFVSLAGILASYNEGATGPGHCDE